MYNLLHLDTKSETGVKLSGLFILLTIKIEDNNYT